MEQLKVVAHLMLNLNMKETQMEGRIKKIFFYFFIFSIIFSCGKQSEYNTFESFFSKIPESRNLEKVLSNIETKKAKVMSKFISPNESFFYPVGKIDGIAKEYGFVPFILKMPSGNFTFMTIDSIYPHKIHDKIEFSSDWSLDEFYMGIDSLTGSVLQFYMQKEEKVYWESYKDTILQVYTKKILLYTNGKFGRKKKSISGSKTFENLPFFGKFSNEYVNRLETVKVEVKEGEKSETKKVKITILDKNSGCISFYYYYADSRMKNNILEIDSKETNEYVRMKFNRGESIDFYLRDCDSHSKVCGTCDLSAYCTAVHDKAK